MPYIEDSAKEILDEGYTPRDTGELTYAFQELLKRYLRDKGLRYAHLAECLGALEGAKLDLIDRVIIPYEHKKREENGDVWPSELLQ